MNTYSEALAQLPADARWSSSFGNPGEAGYAEYHRAPNGERWIITNGIYPEARDWRCTKMERVYINR